MNMKNAGDNSININGSRTSIKKVSQKKVKKTVIVTQPADDSDQSASYEVKELWRTPLTRLRLRIVTALSLTASITSILGLYLWPDVIKPLFVDKVGLFGLTRPNLTWVYIGVVLLMLGVVSLTLGRMARYRLRGLSRRSWLPGLMEIDGRLVLVRFQGRCPGRNGRACNEKLRFMAIPTSEHVVPTTSGSRLVVGGWEPAAICPRDPVRHRWFIDRAESAMEPSS